MRRRIADYLTDLLGIGFSGFRIDSAKHMSPTDLAAILALFKKNLGGSLPPDFLTYLEVLVGGEKDLLCCQNSTYDYYVGFNALMRQQGLTEEDVAKVLIFSSDYPREFPVCGSWILPSTRFAVENDDADSQNPGSSSRDLGSQGSVLIKDKNVPLHRGFEVQLFSRADGDWNIKLVLSSYTFMNNGGQGVPDGKSDCALCQAGPRCRTDCTKSTPFQKAHNDSVCGYTVFDTTGQWAEGVYTRVHRDRAIILAMRQWMGLSADVSNVDIGLPPQCS